MGDRGSPARTDATPPPSGRGPGSTAGRSLVVAAFTLLSRLTGLLRVVVIGAVLGPTYFANTFMAANTAPNLTYTALAGPTLALVLVPALVAAAAQQGRAAIGPFLGRISGYLVFWASVGAAGLMVVSPLVALAVTADLIDDHGDWRAWRLAVLIVVLVAPQVVLYTLAAIGEAVQQSLGRFALAAAAPALESVGLMATMGAFAWWYGTGVEVDAAGWGMVLLLGGGSTLSVALHAAAQLYGAWRFGSPVTLRRGWRHDAEVAEVTHRLRRSLIVVALPALSMFAMLAVAATVAGGVFVFQAALSMYFVIGALGTKAVNQASLPGMSAAFRGGVPERFGGAWRQAFDYSMVASLPALCLLAVFAEPVAAALANGELHDPRVVRWLSGCLVVLAFSQLANALYQMARQAMYTQLDTHGPRYTSVALTATRLVLAPAALLVPEGGYRLLALAASVLAADVVAAVLGLARVRDQIRPQPLVDRRRLGASVLASLSMLPAAVAGSWLVQTRVQDRLPQVAAGLVFGAVAVACFAVTLAALLGNVRTLVRAVRSRLPG
jgi:peptidoglycan biosynthesis protein MviN/MurJ (putative lipid II flippase)